jgi:ADP-heptose:LPS heptosyltransferase
VEQEEHEVVRYGTPSVVLFGPVPPARWGPPARPYHRVIWHGIGAEPGDAPRPGTRPAVLRISAGEVLAGAGDVERACHAVTAQ